jgi:predicted CopG family antitoxin
MPTTRSIVFPDELYAELNAMAKREDRSFSNLCCFYLRESVGRQGTDVKFLAVAADNLRETRRARRVKSATPTA